MDVYIAEIFDYMLEIPTVIGVFTTEEKAIEAIEIVTRNINNEVKTGVPMQSRFATYITQVTLDGFTPAVMSEYGVNYEE